MSPERRAAALIRDALEEHRGDPNAVALGAVYRMLGAGLLITTAAQAAALLDRAERAGKALREAFGEGFRAGELAGREDSEAATIGSDYGDEPAQDEEAAWAESATRRLAEGVANDP
jgi:hypothetical protein